MLAQLGDLRLCALMSLRSFVPAPLCMRTYVLRPFVCARMSGFDHWLHDKLPLVQKSA